MRPKGSLFALEPGSHALRVHLPRQPHGSVAPGAQPQPHHVRQPPTLERPDVAKLEVKSGRPHLLQAVGHALNEAAIDAAHEPYREVEVGGRRPPECRRDGGACGNEWAQLFSLRLGQREPEERPNGLYLRRTGACQCCWTQPLGAIGRQAKWTWTASRPSAMFGS